MAGSIATAYVQVMPSMQGIKGRLEKGFGAEGASSGRLFGSNLVKAAVGILAGAKLGQVLWKTLNVGAELEQNLGGVEAVFGNFASSIKASAEQAYHQMGLSASDYMATANKMGSLFQGSGLTQRQALDLTTKAMQRASDVASVMGIDTAMAMESIAGAAKGNFTMMDNLGVAMNATTLEAYALEKGVNFKWNTATNAQKAALAMEMFFDRTSQYAGNFEREASETFSGALEAMKASAKNLLGNLSLGEDIRPSLQTLVTTTKTFLIGNFLPAVKNVFSHIPDIIRALGGSIAGALLSVFGTDLETVLGELDGIFAPLKESLSNLFSTVSETVGPLIEAFREYAASGQAAADVTNVIRPALEGLAAALTTVVSGIARFLQWLSSGSKGAAVFKAAVAGIAAAFGAWKIITTVVTTVGTVIGAVTKAVAAFQGLGGILGIVKLAVTALGGPITLTVAAVAGLAAAVVYLWNTNEGFRNAVTTAWTAVTTSIRNAIAGVKEGFDQFLAGLQMLGQGAAQIWAGITTGAANLAASVGSFFTVTIPAAIQAMLAWFQQLPAQIGTAFNQVIAQALSWVVTFTAKAAEAAQGFVSRLVSGLAGLPGQMYEIGAGIVQGIANGISAGWNWLTSLVSDLANSLFQAAKNTLGINSPSKVFRDGVGRWIPAGIALGIRQDSGLVTGAINGLARGTAWEFTAALRLTGGPGRAQAVSGGTVVNFVQNVYAQAQTAAQLAQEARYQAEMKVLFGV